MGLGAVATAVAVDDPMTPCGIPICTPSAFPPIIILEFFNFGVEAMAVKTLTFRIGQ